MSYVEWPERLDRFINVKNLFQRSSFLSQPPYSRWRWNWNQDADVGRACDRSTRYRRPRSRRGSLRGRRAIEAVISLRRCTLVISASFGTTRPRRRWRRSGSSAPPSSSSSCEARIRRCSLSGIWELKPIHHKCEILSNRFRFHLHFRFLLHLCTFRWNIKLSKWNFRIFKLKFSKYFYKKLLNKWNFRKTTFLYFCKKTTCVSVFFVKIWLCWVDKINWENF